MKPLNRSLFFVRSSFVAAVVIFLFGANNTTFAQEKNRYLPGEGNTLEMFVYVIGEVENPGRYRVRDDTNLIELLAEAGGPSEFSNLSAVTITHAPIESAAGSEEEMLLAQDNRVIKYDINAYLKGANSSTPPVLKPGDVVLVPKNKWNTWRTVATVLRDISVVASAYFLYLRATRD